MCVMRIDAVYIVAEVSTRNATISNSQISSSHAMPWDQMKAHMT